MTLTPGDAWLEYSKNRIFTNNYQRDRQHAAFLAGYEIGLRSGASTDRVEL